MSQPDDSKSDVAIALDLPGVAERVRYLACELYQFWLAACEEADEALESWNTAPYHQKRTAYVTYRAAVDREDAAADAFICADVNDDDDPSSGERDRGPEDEGEDPPADDREERMWPPTRDTKPAPTPNARRPWRTRHRRSPSRSASSAA